MDKIFVRNYDKAIEETKNMNEEEIIAYCRKKLKRNYICIVCHQLYSTHYNIYFS